MLITGKGILLHTESRSECTIGYQLSITDPVFSLPGYTPKAQADFVFTPPYAFLRLDEDLPEGRYSFSFAHDGFLFEMPIVDISESGRIHVSCPIGWSVPYSARRLTSDDFAYLEL